MVAPKLYIRLNPGRKVEMPSGTTATVLRFRGQDARGVDFYDVQLDLPDCAGLVHQACRDILAPMKRGVGPSPRPQYLPKAELAVLLRELEPALSFIDREEALRRAA